MNTHLLALQLMAAQGCLGAFDTLYHHELTESLAQRHSARRELSIHSARALIYGLLFAGLSAWEWHGAWALVLLAVFGVEIVLTLWDFVVEDRTRQLPATERVTHTVLAINGGAFITLLVLNTPAWLAMPTGFAWHPQGWLSIFLALCGAGVALSGMRDGFAAMRLGARRQHENALAPIHFSDTPESVLVTGATGFIGQYLVRQLLADGHAVTVLTRNPRLSAWNFGGNVRCFASMDDIPPSISFDVVVNLAGARILGWRWTEARQQELLASRVALTRKLVDWIAKAGHKPRLLLNASAIGYYGIQAQDDAAALVEGDAPQPIFMSRLCQQWEQAAHAAGAHGVKVHCMRFGLVLGTAGALPMMLLPVRLGFGGRMGSGRQAFSWIHVHDLVRAIAHVWQARAQPGQAWNFTAPECVSQAEFTRIAAAVLGRPAFFPTPAAPVRLLLGEQADLLLEGQRVAPARLLATGFVFSYPRLRSAMQDLAP
jgi:uncharacterized protein (TIGR01777 family)